MYIYSDTSLKVHRWDHVIHSVLRLSSLFCERYFLYRDAHTHCRITECSFVGMSINRLSLDGRGVGFELLPVEHNVP